MNAFKSTWQCISFATLCHEVKIACSTRCKTKMGIMTGAKATQDSMYVWPANDLWKTLLPKRHFIPLPRWKETKALTMALLWAVVKKFSSSSTPMKLYIHMRGGERNEWRIISDIICMVYIPLARILYIMGSIVHVHQEIGIPCAYNCEFCSTAKIRTLIHESVNWLSSIMVCIPTLEMVQNVTSPGST